MIKVSAICNEKTHLAEDCEKECCCNLCEEEGACL